MLLSELKASAIRLDNDVNGNPRYFFPWFAWRLITEKQRRRAGLKPYRSKKYGDGYVMKSYSLERDIAFAMAVILHDN